MLRIEGSVLFKNFIVFIFLLKLIIYIVFVYLYLYSILLIACIWNKFCLNIYLLRNRVPRKYLSNINKMYDDKVIELLGIMNFIRLFELFK